MELCRQGGGYTDGAVRVDKIAHHATFRDTPLERFIVEPVRFLAREHVYPASSVDDSDEVLYELTFMDIMAGLKTVHDRLVRDGWRSYRREASHSPVWGTHLGKGSAYKTWISTNDLIKYCGFYKILPSVETKFLWSLTT